MFCPVLIAAGGHNEVNGFCGDKRDWTRETRELVARNLKPYANMAEEMDAYIALEPSLLFVTATVDKTLELFQLIDSSHVGLSLDVFNFSSVHDAWDSKPLVEELISKLEKYIFQVHLKDIRMDTAGFNGANVTPAFINIYECHAGEGEMDYTHLLHQVDSILDSNRWAIIEHTPTHKLKKTVDYVVGKADEAKVVIRR